MSQMKNLLIKYEDILSRIEEVEIGEYIEISSDEDVEKIIKVVKDLSSTIQDNSTRLLKEDK